MPPPAPVLSWTGFYAGLNGGYSWGNSRRTLDFVNLANGATIVAGAGSGLGGNDLNGGVFGGQIGYNWQTANWVWGIETDLQWSGQRGGKSFICPTTVGACGALGGAALLDERLEWFGTFRGRLGFTVTPSTLLYATGGLAYGSLRSDLVLSAFTPAGAAVSAAASSNTTHAGWTIGGGIETMFSPNWSAKIEYLYMDIGSVTASGAVTTAAGAGIGVNLNTRVTDNIFRVGINYRFSAGPDAVVARY